MFRNCKQSPARRAPAGALRPWRQPQRVVEYGELGRVRLTTLTREFFMPRFLERDEGIRRLPCEKYPWDGVSGVRPFHELAEATTVGVY